MRKKAMKEEARDEEGSNGRFELSMIFGLWQRRSSTSAKRRQK
jgi:hypothetical protein